MIEKMQRFIELTSDYVNIFQPFRCDNRQDLVTSKRWGVWQNNRTIGRYQEMRELQTQSSLALLFIARQPNPEFFIAMPRLSATTRPMNRRDALRTFAAGSAGMVSLAAVAAAAETNPAPSAKAVRNGRIRQSVVPWCFSPMSVAELAGHSAQMGLESVELCAPKEWPKLKELGLTCAIGGSHGFARGFAQPAQHDECIEILKKSIEASAAFGCPNVITFSGFRNGLDTDTAMKNMVDGLKKIVPFAEQHKVTLCLEMLNSRVAEKMKGHPDYFCDDIERSVEICKQIGSPHLKVLFDIYHVQIMHGDVITRIRQHAEWIGHVHTAGVPGRAELDHLQELNYPPMMQALLDVGYKGFVGQEFIPRNEDKIASLRAAAVLCDV